jgi:ATP-dependent exoDNAse (exonuclease V) alpha subunit
MPDLSPPGTESDFYFVSAEDPEIAVARIVELAKIRISKRFGLDPICDIQVLCPMNRGGVGARSLNIELQAVLNPAGDEKVEVSDWWCWWGRRRPSPSRCATSPTAVVKASGMAAFRTLARLCEF